MSLPVHRVEDGAPVTEMAVAGGTVAWASTHAPHRDWNEDAAMIVDFGAKRGVLVVADGAGGYAGSRKVASLALTAFANHLQKHEGDPADAILGGIDAAHQAAANIEGEAGTTLACAVIDAGSLRVLHVGDSGVMLFGQRGRRKFETVSQSPVGYALEAGLLSEREALHHEDRHLVSSLLGFDDHRIGVSSSMPIAARDTLVLASDGLLDNMTMNEVVELARKGPLHAAVTKLVERATKRMISPGTREPSKPDDLTVMAFRRQ